MEVKSLSQAQRVCEGIINDFESGITDKEETLSALKDYTFAIHDQFWNSAKANVEKNPNYFKDTLPRNNDKI